jgi:hypothetical protein
VQQAFAAAIFCPDADHVSIHAELKLPGIVPLIPLAKSTSQIPARDIIVGTISWRSGPIIPRAVQGPLFFLPVRFFCPSQGCTRGIGERRNKASGKRTKKEKNEKKVFSSPVKFGEFEEWRWLPSEKSLDGATCTTSLVLSHVYLRFPRHRRRM